MQGDVSLTFHDETLGKGFIDDNGILVGLERYSLCVKWSK